MWRVGEPVPARSFRELPLPAQRMMTSRFSYENFLELKKLLKTHFSWIDIANYTFRENKPSKTEWEAESMCQFLSECTSTCHLCEFSVDDDTTAVFYMRNRKCLLCNEIARNPVKQPCPEYCRSKAPVDGDLINPITGEPFTRDVEKCEKCGCLSYADDGKDESQNSDISYDEDSDESGDFEGICSVCGKSFTICECSEEDKCKVCKGPCSCMRCEECDELMTKTEDGYVCKECGAEDSSEKSRSKDEPGERSAGSVSSDHSDAPTKMLTPQRVEPCSENRADQLAPRFTEEFCGAGVVHTNSDPENSDPENSDHENSNSDSIDEAKILSINTDIRKRMRAKTQSKRAAVEAHFERKRLRAQKREAKKRRMQEEHPVPSMQAEWHAS